MHQETSLGLSCIVNKDHKNYSKSSSRASAECSLARINCLAVSLCFEELFTEK